MEQENNYSFGKTVAALRREKGWTQAELAQQLHLTDKAISKWENDESRPDVDLFPKLAKLFDVSIDYLMTGQMPEKEIITISKAEHCAQTDDVALLKDISPTTRDENGKTVVDYAEAYGSKQVLAQLVKDHGFAGILPSWKDHRRSAPDVFWRALYLAILSDTLPTLADTFPHDTNGYTAGPEGFWNTLTKTAEQDLEKPHIHRIFELLATASPIPQHALDFLFSKTEVLRQNAYNHEAKQHYLWRCGISYLLECALQYKNEPLFEQIYARMEQYNSEPQPQEGKPYPLISVRVRTLELLLEKGKIDTAKRLHTFNLTYNQPSIDEDVLRIAALRANADISADELTVQECIHKGILHVDELLRCNKVTLIQSALERFPIHPFETIYADLKALAAHIPQKQWGALLRYAVDQEERDLLNALISLNESRVENECTKILNQATAKSCKKELFVNKKYLLLYGISSLSRFENHAEQLIQHILSCKQQIISVQLLRLKTEQPLDALNEAFFEAELEKGNSETVIIMLYIRLEEILKGKFHYEGDFSEMLQAYCKDRLDEDDDEQTIDTLHRLRKKRNSIFRAENDTVAFTTEDIRFCIAYICKIGKEEQQ